MVPQGEAHLLGSSLELPPAPSDEMLSQFLKTVPGEVMELSYGGGGARTRQIVSVCPATLGGRWPRGTLA